MLKCNDHCKTPLSEGVALQETEAGNDAGIIVYISNEQQEQKMSGQLHDGLLYWFASA